MLQTITAVLPTGKFCLFSVGIICGILLPRRWQRPTIGAAGAVFAVTYIPLMASFFRFWARDKD